MPLPFHFLNTGAALTPALAPYRRAHQLCLLVYMAFIGLWLLVNFWMMPWRALQVGQVRPAPACYPCLWQRALIR